LNPATRLRKPNPVSARSEATRITLDILRRVGKPLPVGVVAVMALSRKGAPGGWRIEIVLPDPGHRDGL